jgi:V/A-type H+/Na+-transporting ATPase subunit I
MSVIPLKKVTLCGPAFEKQAILDELQTLGCLHLVALRAPPAEPEQALLERPEDAYKALKYLRDCPHKRHQIKESETFDLEECVDRVLANKRRIGEVSDRCRALKQRIAEAEPWGDFNLPPVDEIGGLRLWFYRVPVGKVRAIPTGGMVWQTVYRDQRTVYVAVIAENEPPAGAMPVPRTHMGDRSLSQLRKELDQTELELDDLRAERESLTRWIAMMSKSLAEAENNAALIHAAGQTLDRDELFAVQGWGPHYEVERLAEFAGVRKLALLADDPTPVEMPPTLLDNPKALSGAEDLVGFFQTPGYRSCDPSPVLFFSFTLFFAMILSDAGYAALLGLVLLFSWARMGRTSIGRRMRILSLALITASLIWGAMVGSYFGVSPPQHSLFASFKFFDFSKADAMMQLSVGIGIVHLVLANGCMAWHTKGNSAALVPLGWISVMLGGFALWLSQTDEPPMASLATAGTVMLGTGLVVVFLFSSQRSIKRPTDLLWRLFEGIFALTKSTKLFGDVLSYLRLFALGLASTSLATIFNHKAAHVLMAEKGLGVLLCLLIWIFGHGINLLLAVMSGIVHGLRLNFLEYYNWSVSEEGYPFKAFSKKEIHQ